MRSHVCPPMQIKVDLELEPVRARDLPLLSASPTHTWPRTRSSRRGRCWPPAARDRTTPCRCRGRCPGPGRRRRSGLRWSRRPGSVKIGSGETQADDRGTQDTAAPGVKLFKQRSEPAAGHVCRLPRRAPRLWARSTPLLG